MTLNRELFVDDPTKKNIPNLGVAKVGIPADDNAWDVLRYELSSFVCDGEYERGLDKILTSYLASVGQEQPAVWVSGFYGSGKSHLVRVLEALWQDTTLPDGATARGLTRVSQTIDDHLKELSTLGRRQGGLWAASGTLGAGAGDIRLAFLAVVLRAAGLPEQLAQAECVLWMGKDRTPDGDVLLDAVRQEVSARGLDWEFQLDNMYASELAEAILAARPGWAASADQARDLLARQFPERTTITLDQTLQILEEVLELVSTDEGKLPCALIVLDEMQQFINDDPDRAQQVQLLIEACSSKFGGQVVVVTTGQSALSATAVLQKLKDRFAVEVQLSDQDVETVIREVVLRKRPETIAELQGKLEQVSGEISKQLAGARIAHKAGDAADLVPDYPLLPARRRFWEQVLKAVDKGGRSGQLRTQLKVVHEANREVADREVGTVVPADFVFDIQANGMLTSGALLRETKELIESERAGGSDGELRARILATVFLISQLPREGFADTGVLATPGHVADLLVSDLGADGDRLRRDVPTILDELVDEAKLQRVGEEYSLQTREGQEWTKDFGARAASIRNDPTKVQALRDDAVRKAVSASVPRQVPQGSSSIQRSVSTEFGNARPAGDSQVSVWVRTGWDLTEKQARDLAAGEGTESALVIVFLPKHAPDALQAALVDAAAARETIDARPSPTTDEGRTAAKAMASAEEAARARVDDLVRATLQSAIVLQGGGTDVVGTDLRQKVTAAAGKSLVRLFPKFGDADRTGWDNVVKRAQQGDADALGAVKYSGAAKDHPLCKPVLDAIPGTGTSGNDLRSKFEGSPYGWPRDAVHAALFALMASGDITAEENGSPVGVKSAVPTKIGKMVFRRESTTISAGDRISVRSLLQQSGVPCESGEEAAGCAALLQRLRDLAATTGGAPPLPRAAKAEAVDELQGLKGNELIRAVLDRKDEVVADVAEWTRIAALIPERQDSLRQAQRLAEQLPETEKATELRSGIEAITDQRLLLQAPDPTAPLVLDMAAEVRAALAQQFSAHSDALEAAMNALDGDETWGQLTEEQRGELLGRYDLRPQKEPDLSTPDRVLAEVGSRPLSAWSDRVKVIPANLALAREAAAKLLVPKAVRVTPPTGTVNSVEDIEAYVENLRKLLQQKFAEHGSIII